MSPRVDRDAFLHRVAQYATQTGINWTRVPRRGAWKSLGLPDMRGFTPHLRTVNLYQDAPAPRWKRPVSDFSEPELWLIHDLMHIAFYDFATVSLGRALWKDRDRFLEVHLASEAFAVLSLDYHFLIHTPFHGLAVDLSLSRWKKFQAAYSALPDPRSFEFCRALTDFYLAGSGLMARLKLKTAPEPMTLWWGHEARYAQKQRRYVLSWLEDLEDKKLSHGQVALEGTCVAEPLWNLIHLFHYSPDREWKSYLEEVRGAMRTPENYFSHWPKYRHSSADPDFRFTDVLSLPAGKVRAILDARGATPDASNLYLFWQILAAISPATLSKQERGAVKRLAISSQTKKVSAAAWNEVFVIVQGLASQINHPVQKERRSTFFLP